MKKKTIKQYPMTGRLIVTREHMWNNEMFNCVWIYSNVEQNIL